MLTIQGDYLQDAGSALEIEIAGAQAALQYDVLEASGAMTINGTLKLKFIDGFAPKMGQIFRFLEFGAAGLTGSFSDVNIIGLAPGFQFTLGIDGTGSYGLTALNDGAPVAEPRFELTELAPQSAGGARSAGVTFQIPAQPPVGARYKVMGSFDLVTWSTIASKTGGDPWTGTATIVTDPPLGGITFVRVVETLPLNAAERFHRLEAE